MSLWVTVLRPAFIQMGIEYIRRKVLDSGRKRDPESESTTQSTAGRSCSGTGGSDGSRTDGCKADR